MRALTLLEELSAIPGNPHRIEERLVGRPIERPPPKDACRGQFIQVIVRNGVPENLVHAVEGDREGRATVAGKGPVPQEL
jgi:hypothetical protein